MYLNKRISLFKNIIFVLCLCALLVGCTVPLTVYVYNNSGVGVEFTKFVRGEVDSTHFLDEGGILKIKAWGIDKYEYTINKKTFLIDTSKQYIPEEEEYMEISGVFKPTRRSYVQLEADGAIYLLKVDEKPPIKNFSNQPEWFPLHTEKEQ